MKQQTISIYSFTIPYCPKCKKILTKSDLKEYDFVCINCDENFYKCEVIQL